MIEDIPPQVPSAPAAHPAQPTPALPWERIKAAGIAAGMAPEAITREALRIGSKHKRAELTAADAEAFVRWVEDTPPEDDVPPPTEQDVPF